MPDEEMLKGEQANIIKSILYVHCIMYILAFKEYEYMYIYNMQPYKEEEEKVTEEQTEAVRKEEQLEECKMKRC